MTPRLAPNCARRCARLRAVGYHVDGVPELLGDEAHAALGRDEPVPARLACPVRRPARHPGAAVPVGTPNRRRGGRGAVPG